MSSLFVALKKVRIELIIIKHNCSINYNEGEEEKRCSIRLIENFAIIFVWVRPTNLASFIAPVTNLWFQKKV